jgi:hypothetical protein
LENPCPVVELSHIKYIGFQIFFVFFPGHGGKDGIGDAVIGGRAVGGRAVGGRAVGGRAFGGRAVGGRAVGGRALRQVQRVLEKK